MRRFCQRMFRFIKKLFTDHPRDMGKSYLAHGFWAILFSVYLLFAGIACFVHAIFPFLFTHTASSIAEWVVEASNHRRGYE